MQSFERIVVVSSLGGPGNHAHALALYFVFYNWVRVHKSLRVTPAMEAGLTDKLMEMSDIVALIDARDAAPAKRGPHKVRANSN